MNLDKLLPVPNCQQAFRRDRARYIPEASGCYALTNFSHDIMYLGLAKNLRRRFIEHLKSNHKTSLTPLGRACLFFWLETPHLNKLERTWMNIHEIHEAKLPLLNSLHSPMFT